MNSCYSAHPIPSPVASKVLLYRTDEWSEDAALFPTKTAKKSKIEKTIVKWNRDSATQIRNLAAAEDDPDKRDSEANTLPTSVLRIKAQALVKVRDLLKSSDNNDFHQYARGCNPSPHRHLQSTATHPTTAPRLPPRGPGTTRLVELRIITSPMNKSRNVIHFSVNNPSNIHTYVTNSFKWFAMITTTRK